VHWGPRSCRGRSANVPSRGSYLVVGQYRRRASGHQPPRDRLQTTRRTGVVGVHRSTPRALRPEPACRRWLSATQSASSLPRSLSGTPTRRWLRSGR
jgi:hypothetical protein